MIFKISVFFYFRLLFLVIKVKFYITDIFSIQLTLIISNSRYLELCSILNNLSSPLVFSNWSKQKPLGISNLNISIFWPMLNNFSSPLSSFLLLSRICPRILKSFHIFSSQNYQQNCCWKVYSFKIPNKENIKQTCGCKVGI